MTLGLVLTGQDLGRWRQESGRRFRKSRRDFGLGYGGMELAQLAAGWRNYVGRRGRPSARFRVRRGDFVASFGRPGARTMLVLESAGWQRWCRSDLSVRQDLGGRTAGCLCEPPEAEVLGVGSPGAISGRSPPRLRFACGVTWCSGVAAADEVLGGLGAAVVLWVTREEMCR